MGVNYRDALIRDIDFGGLYFTVHLIELLSIIEDLEITSCVDNQLLHLFDYVCMTSVGISGFPYNVVNTCLVTKVALCLGCMYIYGCVGVQAGELDHIIQVMVSSMIADSVQLTNP